MDRFAPCLNKKFNHGKPKVVKLRSGMEDRRLPSHAGNVDLCACVHIGAPVQQQFCRGLDGPVFRSHVQQRSTSQQQAPRTA